MRRPREWHNPQCRGIALQEPEARRLVRFESMMMPDGPRRIDRQRMGDDVACLPDLD
jgi:hypothetical protein